MMTKHSGDADEPCQQMTGGIPRRRTAYEVILLLNEYFTFCYVISVAVINYLQNFCSLLA